MSWDCRHVVFVTFDSFLSFTIHWTRKPCSILWSMHLSSPDWITVSVYILFGTSKFLLDKLQSVVSAAARPVSKLRKFAHITSTLRDEAPLAAYWTASGFQSRCHHSPMHARYCTGISEWHVHVGDWQSRPSSSPFCSLWWHCCTANKQDIGPMQFCCQRTSHLEWAADCSLLHGPVTVVYPPENWRRFTFTEPTYLIRHARDSRRL